LTVTRLQAHPVGARTKDSLIRKKRERPLASFEDNYHQNFLRALTKEEELELKELHCQLDARFGEVVAFIAHSLGCSEAQAHEEAKQATHEWDIAANEIRAPVNNHLTPLLAKHFEIKERILNIRHEVMVRWDGDDYRESGI
jgi:hypothetical protein